MSVRVPPELRAWLVDYALMRGVAVGAIVVAALEDFRELCAVGVPDLPAGDGRSVGVGRVRRAGSRASSSPGAPAASSRPAAGAPASVADVVTGTGPRSTARAVPDAVRARQERLNRAKGMPMRLERDPAAPRHGYTRYEQEMPMRAHGTANGYTSWGCRCANCREAWRVYSAERAAYRAAHLGLDRRGRGVES